MICVRIQFLCCLAASLLLLCAAHTELFAGKRFPRIPRLKAFTRLTRNFRNRRFRTNHRTTNRRDDESPQLELTKTGITSSSPETLRDSPSLVYATPVKRKSRVRTKRYYQGNKMGRQGVPESFISISVP